MDDKAHTAYDPMQDLALLLGAAQRIASGIDASPGLVKFTARLTEGLGLLELATREEIEASIREALAVPQGNGEYGSGEDEAHVDMVCTFCRMPVVRGGPGWVHLTALDSSRCRRLEADVTAMAAAGNENVPADEHLEDLNTCPEAYRWEAD